MANNLLTVHCRGEEEWSTKLKREKKPKTTTAHVLKVLNLLVTPRSSFPDDAPQLVRTNILSNNAKLPIYGMVFSAFVPYT